MKQTVSRFDFEDAFLKSDTYKNNFTYEGLKALFEYFEEYEESTGEEIEFDMVAICCDYSEYKSAKEASDQYGRYYDIEATPEEIEEKALEWLEDRTTVIRLDNGGVIIQQF